MKKLLSDRAQKAKWKQNDAEFKLAKLKGIHSISLLPSLNSFTPDETLFGRKIFFCLLAHEDENKQSVEWVEARKA